MRILVAEDDQVLADGLLRSLRNAGYAVDRVSSGTEADAALARAIRDQGRVVLPMTQATTGAILSGEVRPLDMFADAAAAIGHSQVEFDPDGIARSVYLWEGFGEARHPQLALALLRLLEPEPAGRFPPPPPGAELDHQQWQRANWLRVPFSGPPGTYTHYSYRAVLAGEVPPENLHNKILMVGTTAAGMGDAVPTPTSGLSRPMPGVEVQANVFDALRRGAAVVPLSPWVSAAVAMVMVAVLVPWMKAPPVGADNTTVKLSVPSTSVSLVMFTVTVALVASGAKVTIPLVPAKSVAVAVPDPAC